jgi:hypothetical protein
MTLPGAENAIVEIEKLRDYCLNPEHPRGKHKARVFRSALGMTEDDAEELKDAIAKQVLEAECQDGETDEYGERFTVDFTVAREGKDARD